MDAIERLLAIEEIKCLKARYWRSMDTKNWAALAEVFAPDIYFDMRESRGAGDMEPSAIIIGVDKVIPFMRAAVEAVQTVHHGHAPEIEITSATTARGIWAMEDRLRWPPGGPFATLDGYGHYHETYERIVGQWKIKSSKLTRLRVDVR
jgi:hypothetical protein